jgi:predicted small lipoprotein YifL
MLSCAAGSGWLDMTPPYGKVRIPILPVRHKLRHNRRKMWYKICMDTFGRGGIMKKAAFCLMAMVLLLSLCACVGKGPGAPQVDITQTPDVSAPQTTPPDAESPEYPFGSPSPAEHPNETTPAGPDKAGRLGFQGGNIGAGGLVCDGGAFIRLGRTARRKRN